MYYVYIIHGISILSKFFSKKIYKTKKISKIEMMRGLFIVFGILVMHRSFCRHHTCFFAYTALFAHAFIADVDVTEIAPQDLMHSMEPYSNFYLEHRLRPSARNTSCT
jgi:hypothetical protein